MFVGIQKHKNNYMEAWNYVKQNNKSYDCEGPKTTTT